MIPVVRAGDDRDRDGLPLLRGGPVRGGRAACDAFADEYAENRGVQPATGGDVAAVRRSIACDHAVLQGRRAAAVDVEAAALPPGVVAGDAAPRYGHPVRAVAEPQAAAVAVRRVAADGAAGHAEGSQAVDAHAAAVFRRVAADASARHHKGSAAGNVHAAARDLRPVPADGAALQGEAAAGGHPHAAAAPGGMAAGDRPAAANAEASADDHHAALFPGRRHAAVQGPAVQVKDGVNALGHRQRRVAVLRGNIARQGDLPAQAQGRLQIPPAVYAVQRLPAVDAHAVRVFVVQGRYQLFLDLSPAAGAYIAQSAVHRAGGGAELSQFTCYVPQRGHRLGLAPQFFTAVPAHGHNKPAAFLRAGRFNHGPRLEGGMAVGAGIAVSRRRGMHPADHNGGCRQPDNAAHYFLHLLFLLTVWPQRQP